MRYAPTHTGQKWVALVDGNNFYVSCERLFRPDLQRRMVGILSNNDGCIISRSEEIKPFVPMGMPFFKIAEPIRQQAVFLSSNYSLYGDISARIVSILQKFSEQVDVYSIDESFLTLPPLDYAEVEAYGQSIRHQIYRETSIPVGVGIGPTCTLAKFANMCAKKLPEYKNVCVVEPGSAETRKLMKAFPVGALWGVGRRLAPRLEAIGLHTVWDLCQADPVYMRRRFSVVQEKMVLELRGIACLDMGERNMKHNIMTSRSFATMISAYDDIADATRMHASFGAEKLRKERGLARAVMVLLKTNNHRRDLLQHHPRVILPLPYPTSDTRLILEAALQALKAAYKPGYRYIKAGVMLLDIAPSVSAQKGLFDQLEEQHRLKSIKLMETLDGLNKKYGHAAVGFGGPLSQGAWHARKSNRTPLYTADWTQLAVVHNRL